MEDQKVYTVRQFARAMQISEGMAYKMVREGKVKVVKFGDRALIPSKVVDEILEGARVQRKAHAESTC
jgi:excisionase family DNA binding protein